jgi:hypothetical protein
MPFLVRGHEAVSDATGVFAFYSLKVAQLARGGKRGNHLFHLLLMTGASARK